MKPKQVNKCQANGVEEIQEVESDTNKSNLQNLYLKNYQKLQAENKRLREELCQKTEENISIQDVARDLESRLEKLEKDKAALEAENTALKKDAGLLDDPDSQYDIEENPNQELSRFGTDEFVDAAMQVGTNLETLNRNLSEIIVELSDRSERQTYMKSENLMEEKMVEHQKFKDALYRAGIQYNSKETVTIMVDSYRKICRENRNKRKAVLGTLHILIKKVQHKSKQVTLKIYRILEDVRAFMEEITQKLSGLDKKSIQQQTQDEINFFLRILSEIRQEISLFQRLLAVIQDKDNKNVSVEDDLYSSNLCKGKWVSALDLVLSNNVKQQRISDSEDE